MEVLVAHLVVKVLNVQVDAHVGLDLGVLDLRELLAELTLALGLLLRAANEEGLLLGRGALLALGRVELHLVELLHGGLGAVVLLVRDESEALRVAHLEALVRLGLDILLSHTHDGGRGELAALAEEGVELRVVPVERHVLHVQVGPLDHVRAAVAALERLYVDLLVEDGEVLHLRHGLLRGLLGLIVHVAVALRLAVVGDGDLAREHVAEEREGVVEVLVGDIRVQVLDEEVASARLAERRVALRPHDAARAALDHGVVHGVERTLRVGLVVEVHVRVAERALEHGITAHADRGHRAHGVEEVEEETLRHLRREVADVKGRRVVRLRGTDAGRRGGLLRHRHDFLRLDLDWYVK
mmetsp:Transcript_3201/g.6555  ORF Transcript_3201/g.6555 Transcript_3201/m.6555 type:complete len:355 (-) Transcript_3201:60-1124(-)